MNIIKLKSVIVFILGLCLLSGQAYAISSKAGTSGAQFLKIGAGSRAAGMAEAYTAVADDVYSGYYNPAGLTRMTAPEFAGQHVSYFQDTSYEFLSFAFPVDRQERYSRQAFGFSIYNLSVSDIERRTRDTDAAAGLFDASSLAYALSYAYRLRENLGFGGNFKYVREKIDTVSAGAVAFDLGAQYHPISDRPFDVGLSVRNMGGKLNYGQGSDPLPMGVVLGLAYSFFPGFKTGVDFTKYRDTTMLFAVGSEYSREIMNQLAGSLRFGYSTHNKDVDGLNGICAGAGIKYARMNFDFAWVPFGDLGNTFRYTLAVRF